MVAVAASLTSFGIPHRFRQDWNQFRHSQSNLSFSSVNQLRNSSQDGNFSVHLLVLVKLSINFGKMALTAVGVMAEAMANKASEAAV